VNKCLRPGIRLGTAHSGSDCWRFVTVAKF
jgi:hypothetical protein